VDALSEAIDIIRGMWDVDNRARFTVNGDYYQVNGAKRGPAPAHDVAISLGAYKPRMLRLTGAKADGWLPSDAYMSDRDELARANGIIDEAAEEAGRSPRDVRRFLNIGGRFGGGDATLTGRPERWPEQLAELTSEYGISGFILVGDDPEVYRVWGDVATATRELVAAERSATIGGR
jgi:hypothetical protein